MAPTAKIYHFPSCQNWTSTDDPHQTRKNHLIMNRFIIIACTLILSACAGTPFKWNDARQIREGMSTQDVTALIGPPHTVSARDGIVRYVWVEVSMLDYSTKSLSIDFRDGKVVKAPPIPAEFQ